MPTVQATAGIPASRSAVTEASVCRMWKVFRLRARDWRAPESIVMRNSSQRICQARSCPARSASAPGVRPSRVCAASAGEAITRSREVCTTITFSIRMLHPTVAETSSSCATQPISSTRRLRVGDS